MIRVVWLLFLMGHVLGDFYFQTSNLAIEKEVSFKKLLLHCVIYCLTMIGVIVPVFSWSLFSLAIGISVLHLIIDGGKFYIARRVSDKENKEPVIYLVDQLLHIFVLLAAAVYLSVFAIKIQYLPGIDWIISSTGADMENLLAWILILLILVQPCSITIKKILNRYRPINEEHVDEGIPSAGALIGILERLFILLMLYANQFTAIGFVLTAKSIARYNKISETPQFAEYYLLGTLLSSLLIIISYFFVF